MTKQIFINLQVKDLLQAEQFYLNIGFQSISKFNFDHQRCVAWSDNILVMLQTESFFSKHLRKTIIPATHGISQTFTIPLINQESVNKMTEKALQAGAKEHLPLVQDEFVYVRTIEDKDGYCWGFLHINEQYF